MWPASTVNKSQGAVEIPDGISNMIADPIKEAVFEILLDLQVHHPHRALQLNLVEGPFQPCGKGGDLLMVTLGNIVEDLHQDVEWCHGAKNGSQFFYKIWIMMLVGPIYQVISTAAPFNDLTILSQTTGSG